MTVSVAEHSLTFSPTGCDLETELSFPVALYEPKGVSLSPSNSGSLPLPMFGGPTPIDQNWLKSLPKEAQGAKTGWLPAGFRRTVDTR